MMRKGLPLAVALTIAGGADVLAQSPPPEAADAVPLRVEVTISRHQEDEPADSRPYVLAVVAERERERGGRGVVHVDARLPASPDLPPSLHHQNVGTTITCSARILSAGRYLVSVEIEESSLDRRSVDAAPVSAVFRSFTSENALVLRDGQSQRYAAAVDRVTGETVRVDVTLNVLDSESAP